jgi:uncharacterized RDD family membrane protein YckC
MAESIRARAGIGSRSYAFLIDWHIRFVAALAWLVAAGVVVGTDLAAIAAHWRVVVLPAALLYFLYHPVLEVVMRGQTPGKRWAHLRIVTTAGAPPGVGALLVRNLMRLVDSLPLFYGLGLVVMLCTRDQLRLGDLVTGTVVVYDEPAGAAALRS